MRRLNGKLGLLTLIALAAGGCGAPTENIGSLGARIVIDRKVLTYVKAFQVFALKPTTTSGQSVTCDDFPSNFRISEPPDPRLQYCFPESDPVAYAGCKDQINWNGAQTEAQMKLKVPSGQRLLLIVKGIAPTSSGTLAVARGCVEGLQLTEGEARTVTVDALATMGASCFTDNDCELHNDIKCQRDANLPGNYCGKVGCNADQDCLPGSVCVLNDATAGFCARPCDTSADCKGAGQSPKFYNCEGRTGPGGCQKVCIWPEWNKNYACN